MFIQNTNKMKEDYQGPLSAEQREFLEYIIKAIRKDIETIIPKERVKHLLPMGHIYDKETKEFVWDIMEEIQMEIRGNIPEDVFATLRFDEINGSAMVDIYHV